MGVKVREKERDSGIWWVFINHKGRRSSRQVGTKKAAEMAYVKDQLGHASIKMTVDVYGHLVPGANREAVNRLPSLSSPELNCSAPERPSENVTGQVAWG